MSVYEQYHVELIYKDTRQPQSHSGMKRQEGKLEEEGKEAKGLKPQTSENVHTDNNRT